MPTRAQLEQQNPGSRQVRDVGKTAVLVKTGSNQVLTAVDSDSDCQVIVSTPEDVDAVALGRAILDTLPPRG